MSVTLDDLSDDQHTALEAVATWYRDVLNNSGPPMFCDEEGHFPYPHTHGFSQHEDVLSIGGLAGSGKTTIVRLLPQILDTERIAYGTPTHRAARILARKLTPEQQPLVRTYHSLAYFARVIHYCDLTGATVQEKTGSTCTCGADDERSCECPRTFAPCEPHALSVDLDLCQIKESLVFERRKYVGGWRGLIVIDEASMLTEQQVEDVRAFGVPLLLVGDHGQLPPVKAEMNSWMTKPDIVLTQNHRQGDSSGIIDLALAFRAGQRPAVGSYGDGSSVVMDLNHPEAVALLDPDRFPPSPERAVICWTNKQRSLVNLAFHGEGPIREGDRLLALATHELDLVAVLPNSVRPTGSVVFVANGTAGTVRRVLKVTERIADLVVQLDDQEETEDENGCPLGVLTRIAVEQLGAQTQLAYNAKPRGSMLWDYAYAITAHKAQGGEYDDVIVIDQKPFDRARWLYTAVTRAKCRLVIIQWHR